MGESDATRRLSAEIKSSNSNFYRETFQKPSIVRIGHALYNVGRVIERRATPLRIQHNNSRKTTKSRIIRVIIVRAQAALPASKLVRPSRRCAPCTRRTCRVPRSESTYVPQLKSSEAETAYRRLVPRSESRTSIDKAETAHRRGVQLYTASCYSAAYSAFDNAIEAAHANYSSTMPTTRNTH